MAHSAWTGGSVYTGQAALPHKNIQGSTSTPLYTIKAGPGDGDNAAETTISTKYIKQGDQIYIRKKGNAKLCQWSSNFAGLGTIDFTPENYTK